ncbi:MAG: glycosyltransferase [Parachlamydiaceae bacterium]
MLKIDVLCCLQQSGTYGVLDHFRTGLNQALLSIGVDSQLHQFNIEAPQQLIGVLNERRPDCTVMFNGVSPMIGNQLISDILQIPHIVYLVDTPFYAISLRESPMTFFTSVDRSVIPFYQQLGFHDMFFMPHAVEKSLSFDLGADRPYDVVMPASCIDYEGRIKGWPHIFNPEHCEVMRAAVDMVCQNRSMQCYEALVASLEARRTNVNMTDDQVQFALREIEINVRGRDRVALVRSIKRGTVHIFGRGEFSCGWEKYVEGCSNVVVHPGLSFNETLDVMKKSKVVLHSCPVFPDGSHERPLAALACGAAVISSTSLYLKEQFPEKSGVFFYDSPDSGEIDQAVSYYLENPVERSAEVLSGRNIVMGAHTWDHRAAQIVEKVMTLFRKSSE